MKYVGDVDVDGQGGRGDPGFAQVGRYTDGDEFFDKFAVPVAAALAITLIGRPDRPDPSFQLAGHMIGRPGATDRHESVLF
jgi:hypothetical protein